MLEGEGCMKCKNCKQVSKKKYHNTLFPYCGHCNHDADGEKIYLCELCGVSEPSNRMETETACRVCWYAAA
jgi:hypothetical protein